VTNDLIVKAVAAAEDQFCGIDILVNNVGTNSPAELKEASMDTN